ncbi:hypothetical protein BGZ98_007879 [Dissophora globulifera]|nr:hypothetical protein BGZ98_007879 [Dissophora globulifera]
MDLNGPDSSPPLDMGFQEASRLKYSERFSQRDARFRSSESLKSSPTIGDIAGPSSSRHFGPSSAPGSSSISHSREFSPPPLYKTSFNEPGHISRSMEYFGGGSPGMGPARYMDRDDYRGRLSHFPRDFDRDREFRGRDIRQDIRDIRDPRPPRDPRDRDLRDMLMRDRDSRDRDLLYSRDHDYRDRDPRDRDLRELGITTRELRDRDNTERDPRDRGLFSGRDGPEDMRELVEQERERLRDKNRERERDRNRERSNWLHDLDKDHDGSIPTRPAAFDVSNNNGRDRDRDRERDRPSNSRAAPTAHDLDRDLLAYSSDKPRQYGNSDETSVDDENIPTKPSGFSEPLPRISQIDDVVKDESRMADEHAADRDRGQDPDLYGKPDGAGLHSEPDTSSRDDAAEGRRGVISNAKHDSIRHGDDLRTQLTEPRLNKDYPSSHAALADSNIVVHNANTDSQDRGSMEPVIKQETPAGINIALGEPIDSTASELNTEYTLMNGTGAVKDLAGLEMAAKSPSMTSLASPGFSPVPETVDASVLQEEEEDVFENQADILVKIDKIDGEIQLFEDLLLRHRIQKEQQLRVEAELIDSIEPIDEEDAPIDIEKPYIESVADVNVMEVDGKTVHIVAKISQDDHGDMDSAVDGDDGAFSPAHLVPDRTLEDSRLDVIDSEDIDMGVSDVDVDKDRRRQIIEKFSRQELSQPIDEDDPFYKRRGQQTRRPQLYDQIYAENNSRAKKYGRVHSALGSSRHLAPHHRHHDHDNPHVYESIEDLPCYQENIDSHKRLRGVLLHSMALKSAALDEKELELKREYKQYWESWTKKVEKLDKIKEKMSSAPPPNVREEDLVQSDNVLFTTRNRRGAYNSDAVRSEAELMEIIQSLENADMRNPDLRASRTAATVPPMILDPCIRETVHYYDRNHLVTDPSKYYRLGPVTDIWSEEERQIFIKRYLNYPKQFGKISAGIENKTASQCVLFYYREKKKIGFKDMLSNRGRKRKPAAGKRKEKAVQQPSPSGQPGKKSKGSALIEDIGQANRKMAKSKEIRELQDMNQSWGDFDLEPGSRRRVRSGAASQQGGTPGLEENNSNAASPAPSSAVSTPVISAAERRKQRFKGTTTRSSVAVASTSKASQEDAIVEEKPKSEKASSIPAQKLDEVVISVDSPSTNPATPTAELIGDTTTAAALAAATPTPSGGTARWTTAEHTKCIAALKKFGRDFEAVANAVGTKTVDQCRNFCFNYKRKFGVSALDDANNLDLTVVGEDGEDKEGAGLVLEKGRPKKGKATSSTAASAPGTPSNTGASAGKDSATVVSGRRRAIKTPVQDAVKDAAKDEAAKGPTDKPIGVEEPDAGDKKRRKRVASKSETGSTSTEITPASSATSFRALYSRDPPPEASSPSQPVSSQAEDVPSPGPSSADGSARRPNFSSYWSRQEKIDFARLLTVHGKDWEKISKALKTKTAIQVRNHYSNNAEKLAAEGIIGAERTVSPLPPLSEDGQYTNDSGGSRQHQPMDPMYTSRDMAERVEEYHASGYASEQHHRHQSPTGSGPTPGYFIPPSYADDRSDVHHREGQRAVSPPRRVTNIGNLLNNDDEDVHVAVEDWFGNNEESNSQDQEHSFDAERQSEVEPMPRQPPFYHRESMRAEEEDLETEDEFEPRRHSHGALYGPGPADVRMASDGRHQSSEAGALHGRHGYSSSSLTGSGYYGKPHPVAHASQQHPGHSSHGVLGSPYGSQQYYSSSHGYRSPPPPMSPTSSGHTLQRVASPSIVMSSAPSSALMPPGHYSSQMPPHHHSQHQRSSSISHIEMTSRSNLSPQLSVRARSPMSHQGTYFPQSQHHGRTTALIIPVRWKSWRHILDLRVTPPEYSSISRLQFQQDRRTDMDTDMGTATRDQSRDMVRHSFQAQVA